MTPKASPSITVNSTSAPLSFRKKQYSTQPYLDQGIIHSTKKGRIWNRSWEKIDKRFLGRRLWKVRKLPIYAIKIEKKLSISAWFRSREQQISFTRSRNGARRRLATSHMRNGGMVKLRIISPDQGNIDSPKKILIIIQVPCIILSIPPPMIAVALYASLKTHLSTIYREMISERPLWESRKI